MSAKAKKSKKANPSPKTAKRPMVGKGRIRRWALGLSVFLAVTGVVGGASWVVFTGQLAAWQASLRAEALNKSRDLGLSVGDVLVTGRERTDHDALLAALKTARSKPILDFEPAAAADRIGKLPWVQKVAVERLLPDTILVRLEERQPMALWQREKEFKVLDTDGRVVEGVSAVEYAYLPRLVGDDAPRSAPELFALLETEPGLSPRVEAAVRVGNRRWNVLLSGDIDVRLPEEGAAEAWARLAEYDRSHSVLNRDIRILDLRLPDRLIVRTRDHKDDDDDATQAEPAEAVMPAPTSRGNPRGEDA